MLRGGATKKAFTYGKRGRTNAVDHDKSGSASEEDSDVQSVARPRLIPPSRAQKIGHAQQHAARKAVYTSPVTKHAARRDVPLKQDVRLAVSSPARASRVSRQKAKVHNADLLQPTPRRVRVDISTRDDQGREVKQERRTTTVADDPVRWSPVKKTNTRPKSEPSKAARDRVGRAAPPPPQASTSTSHTSRNNVNARAPGTHGPKVVDVTTIDSSDEEEDVVAISSSSSSDFSPIAPAVKRGARKNPITISSDESIPEPPRHSQKSIGGLSVPRKSEVSQATQRVRLTGSLPQRSLGNPLRHSTPKRTPNTSRPRQLTPTIDRYSRSSGNPRLSKPPVPASPSYSELDLSLSQDIAGLNISSSSDYSALAAEPITQPRHLRGLLSECQQESPHEFSAFVDAFPTDVVVRQNTSSPLTLGGKKFAFRKVGEASYSEVFGIGSIVLKIIPLQDESAKSPNALDSETPPPSKASDVLKEITVTRAMADVCGDSFVRLLKTYVVRGRYPSRLLELWDEYDETYGSESVRPDTFPLSQIYVIIILPDGGPDLESLRVENATKTGWRQAYSIFWQVANALGQAEQKLSFEHRDLHWGQILVKDTITTSRDGQVQVTIIDFGNSRMDKTGPSGQSVEWTEMDEEVFEGEGEYQFDIYRMMRNHNSDRWDTYKPLSNLMWLHYLCLKLLHAKKLRVPSNPTSAQASGSKSAEYDSYRRLLAVERLLASSLISLVPQQKAAVEKATSRKASGLEGKSRVPSSAADIVRLAVKQGWKID